MAAKKRAVKAAPAKARRPIIKFNVDVVSPHYDGVGLVVMTRTINAFNRQDARRQARSLVKAFGYRMLEVK